MSGEDIKTISTGKNTQSVDNILDPIFNNLQGWLAQGCKGYHGEDYDRIMYHGEIKEREENDTSKLKNFLYCKDDDKYIELQIENIEDGKKYFISLSILNMIISNISSKDIIEKYKNNIKNYESEEKKISKQQNNQPKKKNGIQRKKTIINNITGKQTGTRPVDIVYIRTLQIINYVETILDNFEENPGIERLRARFFTLVMQFMNLHDKVEKKKQKKDAPDRKKLKLLGGDMMICFNNISLAMKKIQGCYKPYCDITNMKQVFPQFEQKKIKIKGTEKEITISKYMFQNVKFKGIFLRMLAYQNSKTYWDMWLTKYTGCNVEIGVNMKTTSKFQRSSCAMECNSGKNEDNKSCFITSIFKVCSYASNFFTSVVMVTILSSALGGPLFITYLISMIVLLIVSMVCIVKLFQYIKQVIRFITSGLLKKANRKNTLKTVFTSTYGLSTIASVSVSIMIACAIPGAQLGIQFLNVIAPKILAPKITSTALGLIQNVVDKIFTRKWHEKFSDKINGINHRHEYDNFVSCAKKTNSQIIKDKLTNITWINDKISKSTLALNNLVEDIPDTTIDGLILYTASILTGIVLMSIGKILYDIHNSNENKKQQIKRWKEKQITEEMTEKYTRFGIENEDKIIEYENLFLLMIDYYDENDEQNDVKNKIKTIIDNQDYGYCLKLKLNDDQYKTILSNGIIDYCQIIPDENQKKQFIDFLIEIKQDEELGDEGKKEQDEDDIVLRF